MVCEYRLYTVKCYEIRGYTGLPLLREKSGKLTMLRYYVSLSLY